MTPSDKSIDIGGISAGEDPEILEEIEIEDLAVDGICGVY
jgi:mycofactocin precursor